MCLFWFQNSFRNLKNPKKPKIPLLIPKLEKSKKTSFKGKMSGQINFLLFFDPPKCACSDSKTVFRFWKKSKKIQKRPLLHLKLEKSKKRLFEGRKSGQIDFFLLFDPPPKCTRYDSKTVFKFWNKKYKNVQKDPFYTKKVFLKPERVVKTIFSRARSKGKERPQGWHLWISKDDI